MWASAACTVHCLIAPALLLLAPTVAELWGHPASHALIALLVLPLAATVLRRGYVLHHKRWIAITTVLGAVCVLLGCVLPYMGASGEGGVAYTECCPQLLEDSDGGVQLHLPAASIATVLGSVLLIISHLGNLVSCRRCAAGY